MGRVDLNVDSELEKKFKTEVFRRKGMKRGNLTASLQEAMLLWIRTPPKKVEKSE